jgi:hypothetical protein
MKLVPESLNEIQNFNRNLDPLDSMHIGMQSKSRLIDRMKESYRRGYHAQNKETWGFTPRLWNATIKKILDPSTKIDITDSQIIISSPLLKRDHLNLILNSLNFITSDWNIKGFSCNISDKSVFTFVSPISESFNFEREGSPIKQMDIGQTVVDREFIKNTKWEEKGIKLDFEDLWDIVGLIKNYHGYPIVTFELKDKNMKTFLSLTTLRIGIKYCKSAKESIDFIKSGIDLKDIKNRFEKIGESINFERSGSPIEKMDIGKVVTDMEIIASTKWDNWTIEELSDEGYEPIELIRDYKGYPILIVKDKDSRSENAYLGVIPDQINHKYFSTIKETIDFVKSQINLKIFKESGDVRELKESINFERSGNPLEKMGIGHEAMIKKRNEEI